MICDLRLNHGQQVLEPRDGSRKSLISEAVNNLFECLLSMLLTIMIKLLQQERGACGINGSVRCAYTADLIEAG